MNNTKDIEKILATYRDHKKRGDIVRINEALAQEGYKCSPQTVAAFLRGIRPAIGLEAAILRQISKTVSQRIENQKVISNIAANITAQPSAN